jgi:hypothetical protein
LMISAALKGRSSTVVRASVIVSQLPGFVLARFGHTARRPTSTT